MRLLMNLLTALKQHFSGLLRQQRRRIHIGRRGAKWSFAEWQPKSQMWRAGDQVAASPEAAIEQASRAELRLFDTRMEVLHHLVDMNVSMIGQELDDTEAADLDEAECIDHLLMEWIDIEP